MMLTLTRDALGDRATLELPHGSTAADATTARLWTPEIDPAYVALAAARLSRRVSVIGVWGRVECDDGGATVLLRVE